MKQKGKIFVAAMCVLLTLSAVVACGGKTTKLTLNKTELSLTVGQSETLTVTGAEGAAEWSSADTAVATVADGKVTAVGVGQTVITAAADGAEAKCTVTVSPTAVPLTVVLSQNSVDLKVDETITLIATVLEETAVVEANVTFTSENTDIASTDGGKVTGVAPGTTAIQVKATYQGKEKTVEVPVTVRLDAEIQLAADTFLLSVYELDENDTKSVAAGAKLLCKGVETPAAFSYESDAPSVFTVSADGTLTAVGKGKGKLTVTATLQNSPVVKTIPIEVVKTQATTFEADFSAYDRAMLNTRTADYDLTQQITATVQPYVEGLDVEWISSSDAIATVTGDGLQATVNAVENCRGGEASISLYIEGIEAGSIVVGVYFPISSEEDLAAVDDTADSLSNWYLLTNDIQLTQIYKAAIVTQCVSESWNGSFKGVLDGNGYTISNLRVDMDGSWNMGIVGYNVGIIRNLRVETTDNPTSDIRTENIRSKSGAIAAVNEGVIENCMAVVNLINPHQANASGGGIVGVLNINGVVRNCYTEVTIQPILSSGVDVTGKKGGAIVGCLYNGALENCWSVKEDSDLIGLYGFSQLDAETLAAATDGSHVATTKAALLTQGFSAQTFDASYWDVTVSEGSFTVALKKGCMMAA